MNSLRSILIVTFFLTSLCANTVASADGDAQTDAVVRLADGTPVGSSTLIRYSNRVSAIIRTTDLDPGSAMTVWWRIYNRPGNCGMPFACELADLSNPNVDGSQLHATAFVVGDSDGGATVIATLYRTAARAQDGTPIDASFDEAYLSGRGLRRPLDAEVELLLANHGRVADPVLDGDEAALDQVMTPGGSPLDCYDDAAPTPGRTYRCGVIQKTNHAAGN